MNLLRLRTGMDTVLDMVHGLRGLCTMFSIRRMKGASRQVVETLMVAHGAPTLAGIKPANLMMIPVSPDLPRELAALDERLREKGLRVAVLKETKAKASVYLYREADLTAVLECPAVREFLSAYGYQAFDVDAALNHLRARLKAGDDFPHEIGVFLGYPLRDVIGFIRDGGKNCTVCGCWKAYGDPCAVQRIFDRYARCREVLVARHRFGATLEMLTVAVRPHRHKLL